VYLARPEAADGEAFCGLVHRNRTWLARWVSGDAAECDPDGAVWFERMLAAVAEGRSEKMFVRRTDDGRLLGVMNLNEIVRGSFQSAYLGYWIGEAFARRGYMADALDAALTRAFSHLGLHRVEANIQPGNLPSLALVRAAGFRREGFSPAYLQVGGRWCDHERWALTAEDRSARASGEASRPGAPPRA